MLAAEAAPATTVMAGPAAAVSLAARTALPLGAAGTGAALTVAEVIACVREPKAGGGDGDAARQERGDENAAIHDEGFSLINTSKRERRSACP
jgi:hypothetical protein